MGRELCVQSIPVPSTGCKASGCPRSPRAEPKPCDRAREPPCCWRQQLSDEPHTKKSHPSSSQERAPACLRPLTNPQRVLKESPCSPQSPGPAPAAVITFCLLRSPLPPQLKRARASVCPVLCSGFGVGCLSLPELLHPWVSSKPAMPGGSRGSFTPPRPVKFLLCWYNQFAMPVHGVRCGSRLLQRKKNPLCKDLSRDRCLAVQG